MNRKPYLQPRERDTVGSRRAPIIPLTDFIGSIRNDSVSLILAKPSGNNENMAF